MWSRLEDLFRLIDEGEQDLGIPPYNGGLFDRESHDFLTEHEVSNRYLAEVIYRLSRPRETTRDGTSWQIIQMQEKTHGFSRGMNPSLLTQTTPQ